jgi:hypothetical protein
MASDVNKSGSIRSFQSPCIPISSRGSAAAWRETQVLVPTCAAFTDYELLSADLYPNSTRALPKGCHTGGRYCLLPRPAVTKCRLACRSEISEPACTVKCACKPDWHPCTVRYDNILYYTILYCTVLYCT